MDLATIRQRIDSLDREILDLVELRLSYALAASRLRGPGRDPEREREILEGVERHTPGLTSPVFRRELFASIIEECRRHQGEQCRLVGIPRTLGDPGRKAARLLCPGWVPIPCASEEEAARWTEHGTLDGAILLLETSLAGLQSSAAQNLMRSGLFLVGESLTSPAEALGAGLPPGVGRLILAARASMSSSPTACAALFVPSPGCGSQTGETDWNDTPGLRLRSASPGQGPSPLLLAELPLPPSHPQAARTLETIRERASHFHFLGGFERRAGR